MIIKSAELETVCGPASKLPENSLPEIAFAGRSNVGKSSLINTLTGRRALARTSQSPGKTRTLNFYNINKELYLVDLPGYGYASASRESREKWAEMIDRYLRSSKQLRAIFVLVDIRHEAKASDKKMCEWAALCGVKLKVIATKSDKIGRGAAAKQIRILKEGLELPEGTEIIPFSAAKKSGIDEVWRAVLEVIS